MRRCGQRWKRKIRLNTETRSVLSDMLRRGEPWTDSAGAQYTLCRDYHEAAAIYPARALAYLHSKRFLVVRFVGDGLVRPARIAIPHAMLDNVATRV